MRTSPLHSRLSALLTPCLLIAAAAASASTYYVSATGKDLNTGISLSSPFLTIQHAITTASEGDTVLVASGTYKGSGNRNIDFGGTNITLGAATNSDGTPGSVTIDAQNGGRGFVFQSGETAASVVDSFTVIHVYDPYDSGGAMNIKSSSHTFTNCTFSSSTAFAAGGVFVYSFSNPSFTNCVFSNNTGKVGGGTYMDYNTQATFSGCSFTGNTGRYGGAVYTYCSSDSYTDCTFDSNKAEVGGALYTTTTAAISFKSCTFSNNTASDRGGASFTGTTGIVTIYNGLVFGNSAVSGGGFYNSYKSASHLYNTTITGNSATSRGGAVYNGTSCSPTIFASILWNDSATTSGNEIYNASTTSVPCVTYSDVQGGWSEPGNTNLNTDPLFVSATDYHLSVASLTQQKSPLIDAGPNYDYYDWDQDSNQRITNGLLDIGAYELVPPTANPDAYRMSINATLTVSAANGVLANDLASNGGLLSAVQMTKPLLGTLTLKTDGSFTYKPVASYKGVQIFTYKATNGNGASLIATVTITIG